MGGEAVERRGVKILVTGGGGRGGVLTRAFKARVLQRAPVMDNRLDRCTMDGSERKR